MKNVLAELVKKYSQQVPSPQNVDPNQTQPGQSVYDATGKEFVVIQDDPSEPNKVLMPADQKGKDVPEGVKTIDNSEITQYSNQNPIEQGTQDVQTASVKIEKEFLRRK